MGAGRVEYLLVSSQVLVPLLGRERAEGPEDHIQRGQPEQDQKPLPARHDARREIDQQAQVAEAAFQPGLFDLAFHQSEVNILPTYRCITTALPSTPTTTSSPWPLLSTSTSPARSTTSRCASPIHTAGDLEISCSNCSFSVHLHFDYRCLAMVKDLEARRGQHMETEVFAKSVVSDKLAQKAVRFISIF